MARLHLNATAFSLLGMLAVLSGVIPVEAQGKREKMNARMIAPVQEDVPAGFQYIDSAITDRWQTLDCWMASPQDPSRPISPKNQARETLVIDVYVGADATDTRKMVNKFDFQVQPVQGTYSGAKIGDFSLRGANDGKDGAMLTVVRGNVMIRVVLVSRPGLRSNAAAEVERIARLMVARADAAIKLGAAPQKSLKVADKSITGQEVKDAGTVAPVSDLAKALGAKVETSKTGSRVTLTAKEKKVELVVGRAEVILNGKKSTLKFPALQTGKKGQVLCLVEPIATAFGAKVST
jgi:hypothetical protein